MPDAPMTTRMYVCPKRDAGCQVYKWMHPVWSPVIDKHLWNVKSHLLFCAQRGNRVYTGRAARGEETSEQGGSSEDQT
jgi:hypothetical protein